MRLRLGALQTRVSIVVSDDFGQARVNHRLLLFLARGRTEADLPAEHLREHKCRVCVGESLGTGWAVRLARRDGVPAHPSNGEMRLDPESRHAVTPGDVHR